jgi:4-amino-4-deoxy-L-arabinose transferase-like glycosyltransferase
MALPWTLMAPLVLAAALRRRRQPTVRLLLVWFVVSIAVIVPIANQRTRYLLPMTPPLALLVAWWSTFELAAFATLRRALAVLSLVAGAAGLVAIVAPSWLGGAPLAPYLDGGVWSALPLIAALAVFVAALAWGLYAAAPRALMYGAVGAMAVVLGYGIWAHNRHFNVAWDFPGLAATVERHAHGGDVGVFGGRWFALDYYLGRPVYSAQSLREFTDYVRRPERPIVVTNNRTWKNLRASLDVDLQVLDEKPLGGQTMVNQQAPR